MKTIFSVITFFTFVVMTISGFAQNNNWKLECEKDSMFVYTRQTENSRIKELKIELDINASLSTIVAVLEDVDYYTEWIYSCKESELVEHIESGDFYYYVEMDLPWPMSNRDIVQHSISVQDSTTLEIDIKTLTEKDDKKVKEKEGIVRLVKGNIHWKLTPISNNKTHVFYYLVTDPGGNLPAWLINLFIEVGPTNSMNKLREIVVLDKFKGKANHIIDFK